MKSSCALIIWLLVAFSGMKACAGTSFGGNMFESEKNVGNFNQALSDTCKTSHQTKTTEHQNTTQLSQHSYKAIRTEIEKSENKKGEIS